MSISQFSSSQPARVGWRGFRRFIPHSPPRLVIHVLEWIAGNDAGNRGLGTLTSLISVIAVVIAVYQYYASASERELQTELSIWDDLTNNTGQKDAIELLAMHGVSMPPKARQASCASSWFDQAMVKRPWYEFGFLLAPLSSAYAATTAPAASSAGVKTHPASVAAQKPTTMTTRRSGQGTSPPI
jgi:hypothetical protein